MQIGRPSSRKGSSLILSEAVFQADLFQKKLKFVFFLLGGILSSRLILGFVLPELFPSFDIESFALAYFNFPFGGLLDKGGAPFVTGSSAGLAKGRDTSKPPVGHGAFRIELETPAKARSAS